MMDFISVPATCGIIFYFIYSVFDLYVRRKERIMLIEKMGQEFDFSDLKTYLPKTINVKSFTALRIGCLLMGLGLGLLIGLFIYLFSKGNCDFKIDYQTESVIYGAPVLLFGGLGLLIAYIIESKTDKKGLE